MTTDLLPILRAACQVVGVDAAGAELLRQSENTIYRLPGRVVARISRPGRLAVAAKELQVAGWLADSGVRAVEPVPDQVQPVAVDGRAVTFWRELPEHRFSTHIELARMLRALHALPPPPFALPTADPFVDLDSRIAGTRSLSDTDRQWLLGRLNDLRAAYAALPPGLPYCAVHGDAWAGNFLVTEAGTVVADLERFGYGPPEWDLSGVAVDHITFGYLSAGRWQEFSDAYGYDVVAWTGFDIVRDARELRKVTFAFQVADDEPNDLPQATYRLACIRGLHGSRPWKWIGLP